MDGNVTLGRGQVYPIQNYKRGAKVWHRDPNLVWIGGDLEDDVNFDTRKVKILLEDGNRVEIEIKSLEQLPFLRNPSILVGKDDLTLLSYLHEPAVLHNLQFRFVERQTIYTYCGIVLVAINPYVDCSHMYNDDIIQVYRGAGKSVRELDPHIFAVAEEAYYDMKEFSKSQSIIVSGESGAGKTVSAKFVMQYLASVAVSRKSGEDGIEKRVLASNPIMESIGNAKTIRNDNSSRFGKFIQINFCDHGRKIAGAEMKTYLLEKSRLVFQAPGERNYHVFYQMCAGRYHPVIKDFHLGSCESYAYLTQGGDSRIPGVDDKIDFEKLIKALQMLGFEDAQVSDVFRVLAGLLLLGNVRFESGEGCSTVTGSSQNDISRLCAELWEINEDGLKMWLTRREIKAVNEVVVKALTNNEATRSRDALTKMIYAQLFHWLHVFKLEQEEYIREEIDWVRVDFHDNQPAIDLIEGSVGLINLLDEQCKRLNGSDGDWLSQLSNSAELKRNPQLAFPRVRCNDFIVRHFAADVTYTTDGFVEKNRDSIGDQLIEVIASSRRPFMRQIVRSMLTVEKMSIPGRKSVKRTVASQFRDSLRELMNVLCSTRPHYVRCIKPNDSKISFDFEPKRAIQQLRACGVLETVRISAAGFPSRYPFDEFSRRYRVLHTKKRAMWRDEPRRFAEVTCSECLENGKYALGKTKIFLRTGQVAVLERIRLETLSLAAVMIQKTWKGFVTRRKYEIMKKSLLIVQASLKAFLAFRRMKYLQMHRAVIVMQSAVRGFIQRRKHEKIRASVIAIQAAYRASLVRIYVEKVRYEKSAITIQSAWRGYQVRREQIARRKKIVMVQCAVRKWLAKRRLRELKINARSVDHLQRLNTGLENKIIELQMRLDSTTSRSKEEGEKLTTTLRDLARTKADLAIMEEERLTLLEAKNRAEVLQLEVERLETECDLKEALRGGMETKMVELQSKLDKFEMESETTLKVAELMEQLEKAKKDREVWEEEKGKLLSELNTERAARSALDAEIVAMRDQLMRNVNLFESGAFSRMSSMRRSNKDDDSSRTTSNVSQINSLADPPTTVPATSLSIRGSPEAQLDDVALIIRQQSMINEMRQRVEHSQRETARMKAILEASSLIESLDKKTSLRAFETNKMNDLENAYNRLKNDMERLTIEKQRLGLEHVNVHSVFERIMEENERYREESAELRAMLSNHFERQSVAGADSEDGSSGDLEEDLCIERQCRQLKSLAENLTKMLTTQNQEMERLRQQRIHESQINFRFPRVLMEFDDVGTSATVVTPTSVKARMTSSTSDYYCMTFDEPDDVNEDEISNSSKRPSDCSLEEAVRGVHKHVQLLAQQNMDLNEKLARQSDELAEARSQLRGYSGPLGLEHTSDEDIIKLEAFQKDSVTHCGLLEVYNVPEFARIIVCEFKPRIARLLTKNLPAYLLLAAFRVHDENKDDTALTSLFSSVHIVLKDTISSSHDLDILSLWLVNSWRLFNLLRQYGGDDTNPEWQAANTEQQNRYRFKSYDVAPIREQLKLRVEEIYSNLMKKAIEHVFSPKIVPGILQHESSSDLMTAGQERRGPAGGAKKGLDDLLQFMDLVHAKLVTYGADAIIINQVVGQMAHWMCSLALNYMMFRRDLCNFEKAIQIKHNVTEIQSWLSSKGLAGCKEHLDPLVQACHLLQSRKDASNLDTLCGEMTSKLKPRQVVAILQHYDPSDDMEEGLSPELLVKIQKKLNERAIQNGDPPEEKDTLLMIGTYLPPFDTQPFSYSEYPLETLSLPSCLHLQNICRLACSFNAPQLLPDNRERNIPERKDGYQYSIVTINFKPGLKFGLGIKNVYRNVYVVKVEENSIVSTLLSVADRILDVDGEPVTDNTKCKSLLVKGLKENKMVTVLVERGQTPEAKKEATDEMNEQHNQSVMAPPDVRSILKRLEQKVIGVKASNDGALTKNANPKDRKVCVEEGHKSVMIYMDNEEKRDKLKKVTKDDK
ncbi:unnamed protein product [Caenorhabditis bovis]|uniref:Myosin motor domain-containing protein n=1 Tax=Caenorhabditis bovis TaxID=2654633 RepID=A0A8S1E6F5_9PELO|nr:unnamed protein product [Caenorhabditis bovis]